jgi:hypothetical protein
VWVWDASVSDVVSLPQLECNETGLSMDFISPYYHCHEVDVSACVVL